MWAQWAFPRLPCSAASRATTGAQMARSPTYGAPSSACASGGTSAKGKDSTLVA